MANVSMARYRNSHFSDASTRDSGERVGGRHEDDFGENRFAIMTAMSK